MKEKKRTKQMTETAGKNAEREGRKRK